MTDAPRRAHQFIIQIDADTKRDLVDALFNAATQLERDELTEGCSGSSSYGTMYCYRVDPDVTHDSYFEHLQEYLDEKYEPTP